MLSTERSTAFAYLSRQGSQQVHIVLADAPFGLAQLLDPSTRMQHRRVIAPTEGITDLGQTMVGQFLGQGHRHLPRSRDRPTAPLRQQIGNPDLVILSDGFLDILHRHQFFLQSQQVAQRLLGKFQGDGATREMRRGHHSSQRTLQFTHVGPDPLGDEKRDLFRQIHGRHGGLAHQNRHTGLELGRFDGHRQPPTEARLQAFLQSVDLLRIPVAGQDHLLLTLQEGVEGVEKLLL